MTTKRAKAPETGPRACLRSRTILGQCDRCGETPEVLHVPMRLHGWWCSDHCPCCNPAAKPTSGPVRPTLAGRTNPLPDAGGAVQAGVGTKSGACG